MTFSVFVSVAVFHTHCILLFLHTGKLVHVTQACGLFFEFKFCVIGVALHLDSIQGELPSLGLHGLPSANWCTSLFFYVFCPSMKFYNFTCKTLLYLPLNLCPGALWFLWSSWMVMRIACHISDWCDWWTRMELILYLFIDGSWLIKFTFKLVFVLESEVGWLI